MAPSAFQKIRTVRIPQNPLSDDQKDIPDLAGHAAGNKLALRPECAKYVTDDRKVNTLKLFGQALRSMTYDPNLDTAFPAETNPGVGGRIRLGRSFFNLTLKDVSLRRISAIIRDGCVERTWKRDTRQDGSVERRSLAEMKSIKATMEVVEIDGPHLLLQRNPVECLAAMNRFISRCVNDE